MAQVRNGRVIKVGDSVRTTRPLSNNGIDKNTECSVVDFDERGYPVFATKEGGVVFVVSAFVTREYFEEVV